MLETYFHRFYKTNKTPVVVCKNASGYPLVYVNPSAILLFYWKIHTEWAKIEQANIMLKDLFGAENQQALHTVVNTIMVEGRIDGFLTNVRPKGADPIAVSISGNQVDSEERELIIYFHEQEKLIKKETINAISANTIISVILKKCFQTIDADESIKQILQIAGQYLHVSRSYIFEDLFNEYTRNTYEWCNEGVDPAMQHLQKLKKSESNYQEIVGVGKFIYDDIQDIKDHVSREILMMQNIKAIAIITLYQGNQAIGYVGFDDCNLCRKWTPFEIQSMEQISRILSSLIEKRNVQEKELQNVKALKTILDHFDQAIYVTDIHTNEIVFINRFLAILLSKDAEEVIGKPCWEVLQMFPKPCAFCPLTKMLDSQGAILKREYTWEWKNPQQGRWYQIKDFIIKWFDNRDVHLEIATDITDQKEHENTLKQYASTDMMTGLLKRDWGYRVIQKLIAERKSEPMCICFIDVDGLKRANDNLGHHAGDRMLVHIVTSIRTSIQSRDVMCRWGGDEFIGLIHCNELQAIQLMERVINKLDGMNKNHNYPYELSISYGLVSINENSKLSIEELITIADRRMYEQKMEKSKHYNLS